MNIQFEKYNDLICYSFPISKTVIMGFKRPTVMVQFDKTIKEKNILLTSNFIHKIWFQTSFRERKVESLPNGAFMISNIKTTVLFNNEECVEILKVFPNFENMAQLHQVLLTKERPLR